MQDYRTFFVLGAPKSGTTWLQTILNHHPDVLCQGEGAFHHFGRNMIRAAERYNAHLGGKTRIFGERAFPALTKEEFRAIFRTFVHERLWLAARGQAAKRPVWVGEKDPDHATFCDVMMETFPDAAFIHIVRDGRDHAVSLQHHVQNFSEQRTIDRFKDFDRSAIETARKWARLIRKVRQTSEQAGVRYHELRYEDLIDRPRDTVQSVFEFLDVPRDPEIIARCIEKSEFRNFSGGREPGQEDKSSFFRKGVKGDWRNYLNEQQARAFIQATDGLMEELGYA